MNAKAVANDADLAPDDGLPGLPPLPPPVPQFNPMDVALTYTSDLTLQPSVLVYVLKDSRLSPISNHSRKRTFATLQSNSQSRPSMTADTSLAFGAPDFSSD